MPKLRGMGIFCGGGNFDRGLEEGGNVKFRYAVDWAKAALHSYRANVESPQEVNFFLGSVNEYLSRAFAGDPDGKIARPGDVDVLVGGSPCPGFSLLQLYKESQESKQNASMVASVVSFVDFYAPEYLLLENVVNMTANGVAGSNKDQNVFSQIVAALVGMGYQVQQFLIDAWSFGSSQQRSRVFIVASAPGMEPFQPPQHSHGHPFGINFRSRALGKSGNGKAFGARRDDYTTFRHVSAQQSVADLPYIGDSQPQLCPSHPDHRVAAIGSAKSRARIAVVPTRPCGMGLMQAKLMQRPGLPGILGGEPLNFCNNVNRTRALPGSRMYARVFPDQLFPTIVTRLAVSDGINGRVLHWDQNRSLTVMEARRAQGYLDDEVLVGTPVEQLKIVGNSVDRTVAFVLGLAQRESWMKSNGVHQSYSYKADNVRIYGGLDDTHDSLVREGSTRAYLEDEVISPPDAIAHTVYESEDEDETPRLDHRSVKIALNLSLCEIEEVKRDHFKAIKRILEAKVA